jgi:hypothetical protein
MIDVVTVEQNSPISTNQRNVFSIRNLIYSKDTSDSETDNHSEDSGNAHSSSNAGSSPPRPWSPDSEILEKLKSDLSATLHNFVDTVVNDVVNKVASNYRDTLKHHKSQVQPKLEPKPIEEKPLMVMPTNQIMNQMNQVTQQRAQQHLQHLQRQPTVNHHSALHQQAAMNAVRQSPLFLPRLVVF